jgi:hypothetical protein
MTPQILSNLMDYEIVEEAEEIAGKLCPGRIWYDSRMVGDGGPYAAPSAGSALILEKGVR